MPKSSLMSCPFATHWVFADAEMTPNIGPILDARLQVKSVWVLYTLNRIENAQRLQTIYQNHHIQTRLVEIAHDFEMMDIVKNLQTLASELALSHLAINLSCANKMVTLSAFKAFEGSPVGLYYLLPNDQLKWIQPPGLQELNIAKNIQLAEFLHAHGIEQFQAAQLSPSQASFAKGLVNAIQKIILSHKALKSYQYFSTHHARGKSIKLVKHEGRYYLNEVGARSRLQTDLMVGLLRKLQNQNIVQLTTQDNTLTTLPEEDGWKRGFIEGGWLEYLTYQAVYALKADIEGLVDVAFSVKLQRHNAYDEADVLFLANNQLFLVECKTGSNANLNLHLQRLDSLKNRLGGMTAHALLVTTEPIGANQNKAHLLKVGVIDGKQLPDLKSHLKQWILKEIATTEVAQAEESAL
ncbi:Card1-like endonuclease domain-containing protein [Thiosulfativibrio zosterae]|uniref:Card1 endonuclease domain-containing protein n=1 Tax=Thiosulfativibrio zosterae TaxID=2675053 RepID=A0A6F8PQR8_9GAMM|nr:DUF1887 family CARF protein [Thiosulfativibrio zosterae]BBP44384.1 hypothetical protein THMIRHAT_21300 [Thiosulfativibrio zosterae]